MVSKYLTIKEVAAKWNMSVRRVQSMCAEDRIPGAVKFGRDWAIPDDVDRPEDGRIKSGQYKDWRKKS